jgi:DNA-binding IclR family transcriptional regulator
VTVTVNATEPQARQNSAGIQSIENGAPLLSALVDSTNAMTLTALAEAAGMAPGKAHKYLASFVRCGLVTQNASGGRYDLGPFALELGLAAMRRLDIMELAASTLDDLRDQLGTTVSMAIWGNRGPTIVRIAETPTLMSLTIRIGTVMPMLTSSFGRIFAAFLDRRFTQDLIIQELAEEGGLAAQAGLRSMSDVEKILADFRFQGIATAGNLVDPGRAALSAPVFDQNDRMIAALSVIGVQGRIDINADGKTAHSLRAAANRLSRRMGASPAVTIR